MKVYNQEKTKVLENYDLRFGKLVCDVLETLVPEQKPVEEKFHFETIKEYPNGGKELKKVIDVPSSAGVKEHIEKENIKVFIPYSEQELEQIKLTTLRLERNALLCAFDKWEKAVLRGREQEDPAVMLWFNQIKDLDEKAFKKENVPKSIRYYL